MENAVAAVSAIGVAVGGSSLVTIATTISGIGLIAWGAWELYDWLFGNDKQPDEELEKKSENLQKERDDLADKCKQWQEAYKASQKKCQELISECRKIIARCEDIVTDYDELKAAYIARNVKMPSRFEQSFEACRAQLRQWQLEIA